MYSVPVLILLLAAFAFLASRAFLLFQKETDVREKSKEVKTELSKLESRERELKQKVDYLQTERGKEEEMRGRFMVGKEGEGVIMVIDEKPNTAAVREAPKSSWWSGFLNFFR